MLVLQATSLEELVKQNLKEKVRRPSKTTRMQSHNIEYQTAITDKDQCLYTRLLVRLWIVEIPFYQNNFLASNKLIQKPVNITIYWKFGRN